MSPSKQQGQGPDPFETGSSGKGDQPPPYHDWTSVEDTSLLPPPPSFSYNYSPVANANADAADRAHAWTDVNPLWPPQRLSDLQASGLDLGFASLVIPKEFKGRATMQKPGVWSIESKSSCDDSCLLSSVPLFSPIHSVGKAQGQPITVYYEIRAKELAADSGIALGFIAPPYPSWRLPGWERASLGVHGDDGRRFVNDTFGGRDFTEPFREGETIGLGIHYPASYFGNVSSGEDGEVFLMRNGTKVGSWLIHEEYDADHQPGGVTGLEGAHDLFAAVGVYGAASFEVHFGRHNWTHKP